MTTPITPTDPGTTYWVWKEHSLLYHHGEGALYGVLGASLIRGGPDWRNGPVCPSPGDLRPATLEDFDTYRVCARGHVREA